MIFYAVRSDISKSLGNFITRYAAISLDYFKDFQFHFRHLLGSYWVVSTSNTKICDSFAHG